MCKGSGVRAWLTETLQLNMAGALGTKSWVVEMEEVGETGFGHIVF